jgi:hypothetical protein
MPGTLPSIDDDVDAAQFIWNHLRESCALDTDHERRFLDLYFKHCLEEVTPPDWVVRHYPDPEDRPAPHDGKAWIFEALLPLPQAHLYLHDPLRHTTTFAPSQMKKVDFAFWTGERLIAVEIDGASHVGNEAHVTKDRLLRRSGVDVIHILNSELDRHGIEVVRRLLPPELTRFWKRPEERYRFNPLADVPF